MKTKLEYNRSRDLTKSFTNNQLTEVFGQGVTVGTGYRIKELVITINSGGKKKSFKSELEWRADVAFKTKKTVIRDMLAGTNLVTKGNNQMTIKVTADYVLSQNLNVQLFFDRTMTSPFLAPPYPNAFSKGGVSLRFTL